MARPEYIKDEKTYVLKSVRLDGMRGLRATFTGSLNTSKGDIFLDSPEGGYIGSLLFSNGAGENTSGCDIDPCGGVHDVYIRITGSVNVSDLEFIDHSPYDDIKYEPVPEEKIINNGHDSWEATDMLGRKVASVEDVGVFIRFAVAVPRISAYLYAISVLF